MLLKIRPHVQNAHHYAIIEPASNCLPEWYKKIPIKVYPEKPNSLFGDNQVHVNMTVKSCVPFLDVMTTGYIIKTAVEVEINKTNEGIEMRWRTKDELVTTHELSQIQNVPDKPDTYRDVFKYMFPYHLETPSGYSCLITQPFNRPELPFRVYDGLVDTDNYPAPINFPFQIAHNKNASFLVPEGTPLAQIIPFKREAWERETLPYNSDIVSEGSFAASKKAVRSYKHQFWNKKSYR